MLNARARNVHIGNVRFVKFNKIEKQKTNNFF
jgi:hypothetical protein